MRFRNRRELKPCFGKVTCLLGVWGPRTGWILNNVFWIQTFRSYLSNERLQCFCMGYVTHVEHTCKQLSCQSSIMCK